MRFFLNSIVVLVFLWTKVYAQGRFTQPSGSDGSNTFKAGDVITISWSGIASYPIFSLGIYSTTNATISWLISDSRSRPTTLQWQVDVTSFGFNIARGRIFKFYACNGTYSENSGFTLGFESVLFNIDNFVASSSTTTTTTSQSTSSFTSSTMTVPSPTLATVTVTNTPSTSSAAANTNIQSDSSNTLSTGAKAGIGVGIGVGAATIIGVIAWFVVRKRNKPQPVPQPNMMDNSRNEHRQFPVYGDMKQHDYYSPHFVKNSTGPAPLYEASTEYVPRAELPASEGFPRRLTELSADRLR